MVSVHEYVRGARCESEQWRIALRALRAFDVDPRIPIRLISILCCHAVSIVAVGSDERVVVLSRQ
jgi:hypothetical protein